MEFVKSFIVKGVIKKLLRLALMSIMKTTLPKAFSQTTLIAFIQIYSACYAFELNACSNGIAKIAGNDQYPPLTWYDDSKLTGLSVEVISKILEQHGVKIEFAKPAPWKRLIHQASKGEVDILLGVRENKNWSNFLHYVKPAITPSAQGIFFRSNSPMTHNPAEWEHLKNYVGGTIRGASFGKEFDRYAEENLKLQSANSLDINFLKLLNGRVDYLLAPLLPTQLYIQKAGYNKKISFNPRAFLVLDEFIAISKSSSCIRHAQSISNSISSMIDDQTIDQLLEEHFSIWFDSQRLKK